MRVVRKDESPTKVTLTVSGEAADLAPIRRHVLGHFRNSVKVPGFRAGKAPAEMLEKHINQQQLLDEFMEHALNELYRRALDQQKLRPLSTPNVQLKKFVPYTHLEFEAETEILGPVRLSNYKAVRLAKPKTVITAKDVDNVVKSLQQRLSEKVPQDRPAKNGDEVLIDFEGFGADDGQRVNGASGKGYPLRLGSNSFIPGFEDNLVGVSAGQNKEFTVRFPKDYGVKSLQNRRVTFKVSVSQVQELVEPKPSDHFAKQAGPFSTLAELKADIKKQLTSERQAQAETEYQNELIRIISQKSVLEVPDGLINQEIQRLEDQEKQDLTYRGQTWQEHLESEGLTEEQHRERNRPQAAERVKAGLILSEIAEKEGLKVSPEELKLRLQLLRGQYQDPQMRAELDKPQNQQEVQSRLLTEKTLQKLAAYAGK